MTPQGSDLERLRTGVEGFDELIEGGIPRGFFVAIVGEPGSGKTVFCIHFAWAGVSDGDNVIYVTTEESRESIIRQAAQFDMNFSEAIERGKLIVLDALMRGKEDEWSILELDVEQLVAKVIEAKRRMGYGRTRLVVDSMSAFWLDKPVAARKLSYYVKRVLYKWDMTALLVSQYAVTSEMAYGFGLEHVADGIIRFKKTISQGVLKRYVLVEKMRQTAHDLRVHEIEIRPRLGMRVLRPTPYRAEDLRMPREVAEKLRERAADSRPGSAEKSR
ncbi:MAG: KaiC domain-containing protein [Fervidicoccaceae archaeon]